jgi:hypothetical protein
VIGEDLRLIRPDGSLIRQDHIELALIRFDLALVRDDLIELTLVGE